MIPQDLKYCKLLQTVYKHYPEVKKKMQKPDEINNQYLKWLAIAALKAAQPLAKACVTLSELEFKIQQDQKAEDTISDAFIPLKEDGEGEQMNLS